MLTFWFAVVLLLSGLELNWTSVLLLIAFWAVTTYVALPRFHQILTTLYIPDYFMARTKTGDGLLGDPINIALLGTAQDIHAVMQQAGWTKADPITLRSSLGIIRSSITRTSYSAAPVSNLFLFGNKQEFAYQLEVDGSASRRHHVRFWPTPEGWQLPGGREVDFMAAGTFDKSVGFSSLTFQITHKIDADIDAERDFVVENIRYTDPSCTVEVIENFSTAYHDRNGGGDSVHTDGNMPVVDVRGAAERAVCQGWDDSIVDSSPVTIPNQRLNKTLDHEVPPTQVRLVGGVLLLKIVTAALALVAMMIATARGQDLSPAQLDFADLASLDLSEVDFTWQTVQDLDLTSQFMADISIAVGLVVLYILTLNRMRWSRLLLLIVTTVTTVWELWGLTVVDSAGLLRYTDVALSLLVVLSLSAPSVRDWVYSLRRRGGPISLRGQEGEDTPVGCGDTA